MKRPPYDQEKLDRLMEEAGVDLVHETRRSLRSG